MTRMTEKQWHKSRQKAVENWKTSQRDPFDKAHICISIPCFECPYDQGTCRFNIKRELGHKQWNDAIAAFWSSQNISEKLELI
jgi:hypothetical protein